MLAAAAAWDGLVDGLYSAAASFRSVILDLADGSWQGLSASSMLDSAKPYLKWIEMTAAQAEHGAVQARSAAAAYEAAVALTVSPVVIAANRSQLVSLVTTNFLGQDTPGIAATEADYSEMWAQNAAAMYGYASASLLNPFTVPAVEFTHDAAHVRDPPTLRRRRARLPRPRQIRGCIRPRLPRCGDSRRPHRHHPPRHNGH